MQLRSCARLAATIAGVWLLVGMAGRHGKAGQDRAQDKPAFRAGTELVRVEGSVLDSRREPIRRLTAGDFSVMVDGLSRPVKAVTEVVVTPTPDESLSPPGGAAVASNRQQDAGLVVIIMDDAQTPGEPYMVANAKDAARTFLDGLAPDDRVAVVYTWDRHKSQEFTTDRALLRAAIERFLPGPSDRAGQSDLAYAYTERTVRGVLATLQTLSGHRRSVLLVSQGVSRPGRNFGLERIDADWAFRASDVLETSGARAFARIPVYSVSIAGLTAPGDRPMQVRETRARIGNAWLETLANATGAFAVVDTNDVVSGVRRVLRAHGSSYVIGYEPADDAGYRRVRRLQVSVNRPGATAVIRQYEPAGHEQRVRTAGLANALSGFLPVSAMPMDLVAAVVPGEDGNGAVVMG